MRAVVLPTLGGADILSLCDMPEPRPGVGQVSIRVSYASVNYIDILSRQRGYRVGKFPFVPGQEVSGYIHELGVGVEGLRVGQPVAAILPNGGYAELALADAALTIPLDGFNGQIDLQSAAAFPVVAITAYDLLVNLARLRAGETVLIHAAAGGVGGVAGQLARELGASRIFGTVGSERKIAAAQASGYDKVFLRNGFVEAIHSATEGQGIDVILDAAGEPTRSQSLSLLASFGRLVNFGNASGNPELPIEPVSLLSRSQGILGYSFNGLRERNPAHLASTARKVLTLLAEGKLGVAIAETLSLEQASLAHQHMESNSCTGKCLLRVQAS